jgi:hypothetical protein
MTGLQVLSWNMMHSPAAWSHLADLRRTHEFDVALLQEAPRPGDDAWSTFPAVSETERWRLRPRSDDACNWASAVAVGGLEGPRPLDAREVATTELYLTPAIGYAVSHPGQFVAVDLGVDGGSVTVVSLYGIWDRHDGNLYSEATLHRALSDLTPVLQDPQRRNIVLAGDLNIFVNWQHSTKWGNWAPRFQTVFDRLAAYDLELVGPLAAEPLEGCLCRSRECRHVRTYAHNRKPAHGKYQLDFVFATAPMREVMKSCRALEPDIESTEAGEKWRWSDHLPVLTTFQW